MSNTFFHEGEIFSRVASPPLHPPGYGPGKVHQPNQIWQCAIASFSRGQLQTVLFKVGAYRIAPLKFEYI